MESKSGCLTYFFFLINDTIFYNILKKLLIDLAKAKVIWQSNSHQRIVRATKEMKKSAKPKLLFNECISAIILGSVPCTIVMYFDGIEALISFLKSITPPNIITYYFLFLVAVHFLIWGINRYFYSPNAKVTKLKRRLHQISEQVGFSLLGMYRVLAGSLFTVALSSTLAEPTIETLNWTYKSALLSLASLMTAYILSGWQIKTAARKPIF
ncbi:hypothetical protein [Pseudoalteromonas sp. T1lg22]|uniref:hypothetical protein n=1 Tax=Pseudoalteromonas sp. T1lg22 TaxID=2077096 RepID=UPI000CF729BB|nr:hypothetical protein [Pseudoalteromonas sp. T1lg22]